MQILRSQKRLQVLLLIEAAAVVTTRAETQQGGSAIPWFLEWGVE